MATTPPEPTDEELAERIRRGTDDATRAFETLYRRHARGHLFFLKKSLKEDEALDVIQETWRKVFQGLRDGKFDGRPGGFGTWAFRILNNERANFFRREGRKGVAVSLTMIEGEALDPVDPNAPAPDQAAIEAEAARRLEECLEKLTSEERIVVRAKASGLSREILVQEFREQGIHYDATLHRARKRLELCLDPS